MTQTQLQIFKTLGTPTEKIWPGLSKLPGAKANFVKQPYVSVSAAIFIFHYLLLSGLAKLCNFKLIAFLSQV